MNRRSIAAWTAAYTAIAIALTSPLVFHLSSTVPHDLGDPLLSTSILWWNAHVMPLTARWWDGFAFYPAHGFLTYSDHRLGESLIATPLQWLGATPVTAYNITLLATFPLCAIAAHWLGFTLTKRHDASALCGLAYGFNPFRVAHFQHLELLAAFGMPAALAALHQYARTRRRGWLAIVALALVLQGLCTSYYLLFFTVLLGLWIFWFLRWTDARLIRGVVIAIGAAAVLLAPIAIGYLRVHTFYGFRRSFADIVTFSADLTSLVTASPLSLLWGWMARPDAPERELFPGLTIVVLALAGGAIALRARPVTDDRVDRVSVWMWIAAALLTAIAVCGWALGPWRIDLAVVTAWSESAYKTTSLALVAAVAAAARSSRARDAYSRRSPLAFYLLATAVMVLCALGPKPSFLHHQILYEPPYAWLMRLPVFGSVRAPARFGMVAMLTLSVSGALAFSRFRAEGLTRTIVAAALMIGIVADGWIHQLPLPAIPDVLAAERAAGFAAVIELPLGDVYDDIAAMYRASQHQRPVVNGNSGFEPTHYVTLKTALQEHDPVALDALTARGPALIAIDRPADREGGWRTYVTNLPRITPLADEGGRALFALAPLAPSPASCSGERLPLAGVSDDRRPLDAGIFTDGDASTRWTTGHSQGIGDALAIDLGRVAMPCAISIAVGEFRKNYARCLLVDTSRDGIGWQTVTTLRTAALTIRAGLEDPKMVSVAIALAPAAARFIRLRIAEPAPDAWVVGEITVTGARQVE